METLFITHKELIRYRPVFKTFAHFLSKRFKYNNTPKKSDSVYYALSFFLESFYEIKDKSPIYDGNIFLATLIHKSYTLRFDADCEDIIDDLVLFVSSIEKVKIKYVKHLFQSDSLFENCYDAISYYDYVDHLKESHKYSDDDIEDLTVTISAYDN